MICASYRSNNTDPNQTPKSPYDFPTEIKEACLHYDPAAIVLNYPHNATGAHITEKDNDALHNTVMRDLYGCNSSPLLIHDNPYFAACPRNGDGLASAYLRSGYDGMLSRIETAVPWVHLLSFSKALATANTGLTVVVAHPSLQKDINARLTRTMGLAYSESFMNAAGTVFKPAMDSEVLNHFAAMEQKYKINRGTLCNTFGAAVVPGGVSMTSLLKLDPSLVGHSVTLPSGTRMVITTTNDIVEYLANVHRVITVNNGNDIKGGNGYLRLAQAQAPQNFLEGAQRVKSGLNEITDAPLLNPHCQP